MGGKVLNVSYYWGTPSTWDGALTNKKLLRY